MPQPELYVAGRIQGPPVLPELNPCSNFDADAYEDYKAQLAITALEKRYNS